MKKPMTPNLTRLRKLLLIALSTDADNQKVAALNAINRTLKAGQVDMHWLADKIDKPDPPWLLAPAFTASPGEMLDYCGEDLSLLALNERELEFILSLNRQRGWYGSTWKLSPRQARWLKGIFERLKLTRRD